MQGNDVNHRLTDIRPSPISGRWYEADPSALAASVDGYLDRARLPELQGQVIGVIAPHAGHVYSGPVAGYAFSALRGLHPELVVVLSPFHNYSPHSILKTAHEAYRTPLGLLEVDHPALAELQSLSGLAIHPVAKDGEHSLEIELPFLQRVFTHEFKLLPLMVRSEMPQSVIDLGQALGRLLTGRNAMLVASTDLSHFFDQSEASILDHEMLKRFESMDSNLIFEAEATQTGFACGHAAVASMLEAAKLLGANKVQTLNYATSGDVSRDYSSVVGYGAAVVLKQI